MFIELPSKALNFWGGARRFSARVSKVLSETKEPQWATESRQRWTSLFLF